MSGKGRFFDQDDDADGEAPGAPAPRPAAGSSSARSEPDGRELFDQDNRPDDPPSPARPPPPAPIRLPRPSRESWSALGQPPPGAAVPRQPAPGPAVARDRRGGAARQPPGRGRPVPPEHRSRPERPIPGPAPPGAAPEQVVPARRPLTPPPVPPLTAPPAPPPTPSPVLRVSSRRPLREARRPSADEALGRASRAPRSEASPPPAGSALGRSAGILAAGTFLSRVTGFVRVIVAGFILGAADLGNAYNLANSIPNIIYDLLLGGILSATLIPVFVDELRRDNPRQRDRAISAILTMTAAVLLVLSVALYALAPIVIHLYLALNHLPGKKNELAVGISLLRLFAPQVFFLGAIVVTTALLNSRRQFTAAAFSPVVNNVIAIAALVATDLVAHTDDVALFRHSHRNLLVLGLGTTLGYVAQLLVQLPAIIRTGVRFRPVWSPGHPAVRRVVGLSAWLLGVVLANQVSYNLIVVIASKQSKTLNITLYQTAYQFFQLPYALFAVSIASAIMPDLADRWSANQRTAFLNRVINGLRSTLVLLIPASIGYAVLSTPVILLFYRHGHVTHANAELVGRTLAVFALGLPGFSAFLPLARALQAMKDTRALFVVYVLENALTVVLALILWRRFGDPGLAAAFAGPYTVAAVVTARYLRRKVGALGGVYTARSIGRTLVATGVMAVALLAAAQVLPSGDGDLILVLRLAVEAVIGITVYLLMARFLGIDDLEPVLRPLRSLLARAGLARESAGSADTA